MNDRILEVKNLYKKYYNDDETKYKYSKNILTTLTSTYENELPVLQKGEYWTLEDISFSLNKGDSLAILGDRASGKSLLLKLLTNRLHPDYGTIISPNNSTVLEELRLGISGHLSVLDNLYLKAALVSIPKNIVFDNIDKILKFAEFDREILNTQWKYLTSDAKNKIMYSFLVNCKHNFFVVDGLTHIGDTKFANKCKDMIEQVSEESTFIIATRHSRKVKHICNKVLILDNGKMTFFGEIEEGLKNYDN
ncbi:ATP-binding cassette domain-containing protein [Sulfurimonas sp.]